MSSKKRKNRGFTAVELVVGASIFLLVLGGAVGSLIYALRIQKKILEVQAANSEVDYAVEFMSRALRFAKKERFSPSHPESCLDERGGYYQEGEIGSRVTFINHLQDDACQSFWVEEQTLWFDNGLEEFRLISPGMKVVPDGFRLEIRGQETGDQEQPRVTISLRLSPKGYEDKIDLQTTVSPRYLDVQTP